MIPHKNVKNAIKKPLKIFMSTAKICYDAQKTKWSEYPNDISGYSPVERTTIVTSNASKKSIDKNQLQFVCFSLFRHVCHNYLVMHKVQNISESQYK